MTYWLSVPAFVLLTVLYVRVLRPRLQKRKLHALLDADPMSDICTWVEASWLATPSDWTFWTESGWYSTKSLRVELDTSPATVGGLPIGQQWKDRLKQTLNTVKAQEREVARFKSLAAEARKQSDLRQDLRRKILETKP